MTWAPRARHAYLEAVPGGHVYQAVTALGRPGGWYAHRSAERTDYAWGPYQTKDAAVAALARLDAEVEG